MIQYVLTLLTLELCQGMFSLYLDPSTNMNNLSSQCHKNSNVHYQKKKNICQIAHYILHYLKCKGMGDKCTQYCREPIIDYWFNYLLFVQKFIFSLIS